MSAIFFRKRGNEMRQKMKKIKSMLNVNIQRKYSTHLFNVTI
jgi:hypothetical protein